MWRICRLTALRQLRVENARMPFARLPVARVSQQLGGISWFFTSIAGVDCDMLLTRSARDLREELGDSKVGHIAKSLPVELSKAVAREDVTSGEIIDLFTIAQKTRAVAVMLDAFDYLDTNYPAHINFSVYGEIFRIRSRMKDPDRLIEIYKKSKPRFQAVPEMVYRFGIVGYLQKDDMESASKIYQEMVDAGHETTNEITSQLMMAYARRGDVEKVQELYNSVDPQIGHWHESCIDRVILSMGIIEQPAKAFEFYSNSSMKLSGGTLMALLSVCINNNCKQQATDILANRKKFNLRLDARGYNRIMLTLEFLERNDEIQDVLEEMVEKKIRFDTKTNHIISRNAQLLEDTNFVVSNSQSRAAGFTISPRIRELLAQESYSEAAAFVDSIVKNVDESHISEDFAGEIPEGALIVTSNVARDAVQAYIMAEQPEKVAALVKGFSVVRGKYARALTEVAAHYQKLKTKSGDELSYAASKAMLFQGLQVYRVNDTLKLFRRFHDPDAALELFTQIIASYWGKKASSEDDRKPKYVNFNIGMVINLVMPTLVENGRMTDALDAFNMMESRGVRVTQGNYVTILRSMQKYLKNPRKYTTKQNVVYKISHFQTVLKNLKDREVKISRAVVGYLCPAYSEANQQQQRLELLEAYKEALKDPNDKYILPHGCYETLLNFTAMEGTLSELKQLYDEAVTHLDNKETLGVPRSWYTIFIEKVAQDGDVEEAEQMTKQMQELCGGFTIRAVIAVLRAACKAEKVDVIDRMVALMKGREFTVHLSDAYELVHLARQKNLAETALDVIQIFEKGNLKEGETAEDGLVIFKEAFIRRHRFDSHALQKVKTMYKVALKACEKGGLWKQALILQDKVATLSKNEVVDETVSSTLPMQPEEKQSIENSL